MLDPKFLACIFPTFQPMLNDPSAKATALSPIVQVFIIGILLATSQSRLCQCSRRPTSLALSLLGNASKYSGTGHATVRLNVIEEHLTIEGQDQDMGRFDLHAATAPALPSGDLSSRFGLFSIRERMIALGGSLEMHSAVGKGTHAILRLPFVGPPPSGKTAHGERAEPVSPEFGQPPDRWTLGRYAFDFYW